MAFCCDHLVHEQSEALDKFKLCCQIFIRLIHFLIERKLRYAAHEWVYIK